MKAEVKKFLADFVKKVIETWVKERKVLELPKEFPEELKVKKGIFVTLLKNGELRGCIGIPYPVASILENAREAAILATQDPRFFPLSENELKEISIEISILGQPKKIEFENEAELLKNYVIKVTTRIEGAVVEPAARPYWKSVKNRRIKVTRGSGISVTQFRVDLETVGESIKSNPSILG